MNQKSSFLKITATATLLAFTFSGTVSYAVPQAGSLGTVPQADFSLISQGSQHSPELPRNKIRSSGQEPASTVRAVSTVFTDTLSELRQFADQYNNRIALQAVGSRLSDKSLKLEAGSRKLGRSELRQNDNSGNTIEVLVTRGGHQENVTLDGVRTVGHLIRAINGRMRLPDHSIFEIRINDHVVSAKHPSAAIQPQDSVHIILDYPSRHRAANLVSRPHYRSRKRFPRSELRVKLSQRLDEIKTELSTTRNELVKIEKAPGIAEKIGPELVKVNSALEKLNTADSVLQNLLTVIGYVNSAYKNLKTVTLPSGDQKTLLDTIIGRLKRVAGIFTNLRLAEEQPDEQNGRAVISSESMPITVERIIFDDKGKEVKLAFANRDQYKNEPEATDAFLSLAIKRAIFDFLNSKKTEDTARITVGPSKTLFIVTFKLLQPGRVEFMLKNSGIRVTGGIAIVKRSELRNFESSQQNINRISRESSSKVRAELRQSDLIGDYWVQTEIYREKVFQLYASQGLFVPNKRLVYGELHKFAGDLKKLGIEVYLGNNDRISPDLTLQQAIESEWMLSIAELETSILENKFPISPNQDKLDLTVYVKGPAILVRAFGHAIAKEVRTLLQYERKNGGTRDIFAFALANKAAIAQDVWLKSETLSDVERRALEEYQKAEADFKTEVEKNHKNRDFLEGLSRHMANFSNSVAFLNLSDSSRELYVRYQNYVSDFIKRLLPDPAAARGEKPRSELRIRTLDAQLEELQNRVNELSDELANAIVRKQPKKKLDQLRAEISAANDQYLKLVRQGWRIRSELRVQFDSLNPIADQQVALGNLGNAVNALIQSVKISIAELIVEIGRKVTAPTAFVALGEFTEKNPAALFALAKSINGSDHALIARVGNNAHLRIIETVNERLMAEGILPIKIANDDQELHKELRLSRTSRQVALAEAGDRETIRLLQIRNIFDQKIDVFTGAMIGRFLTVSEKLDADYRSKLRVAMAA